ncbi:hypothetical protein Acr_10g0007370 [Actinidia rufa]|uniref:Uncharacterized protein n=1 Tax=Actinidia rufa TaxID=165716 RepID=A0A7J0F9H5_9ERIC|nr:hypothetical protein Acr_10g0007370 [Actinidia rufa]
MQQPAQGQQTGAALEHLTYWVGQGAWLCKGTKYTITSPGLTRVGTSDGLSLVSKLGRPCARVQFTFDGTPALLRQWSLTSCRDLRAQRPSALELGAVVNKGTVRDKAFVISEMPLVSEVRTITMLETWTEDDSQRDFHGMSGDKREAPHTPKIPMHRGGKLLEDAQRLAKATTGQNPGSSDGLSLVSKLGRPCARVQFTFDGMPALLRQWSLTSCRDLRAQRPSAPELGAVANKGTVRAKAFVISEVLLVSELRTITVLETWTKDDSQRDFHGMSGDKREAPHTPKIPVHRGGKLLEDAQRVAKATSRQNPGRLLPEGLDSRDITIERLVQFKFDGMPALLRQWSLMSCRDLRVQRPSAPELGAIANKGTVRAKAFIISEVPLVSELRTITVLETWTKDDSQRDFHGMSGDKRPEVPRKARHADDGSLEPYGSIDVSGIPVKPRRPRVEVLGRGKGSTWSLKKQTINSSLGSKTKPTTGNPIPWEGTPRGVTRSGGVLSMKRGDKRTDSCQALKFFLDQLVQDGHLKEFIDEEKTQEKEAKAKLNPRFDRRDDNDEEERTTDEEEDQPLGTIHMMEGLRDPDLENRVKREIRILRQMYEVLLVHSPAKKPRKEATKPGSITFTKADLERSPLVGFNAQSHWTLGMVTVKVQTRTQELATEFVVVDIPSPYNAIIGRDWLHRIKGVASTFHQAIKFATPEEVQLVEEEQEVLEDIERDPEAKVVEDLMCYELDEPSLDHFVDIPFSFHVPPSTSVIKLNGAIALELGQDTIFNTKNNRPSRAHSATLLSYRSIASSVGLLCRSWVRVQQPAMIPSRCETQREPPLAVRTLGDKGAKLLANAQRMAKATSGHKSGWLLPDGGDSRDITIKCL